jgi:hypothetical protein
MVQPAGGTEASNPSSMRVARPSKGDTETVGNLMFRLTAGFSRGALQAVPATRASRATVRNHFLMISPILFCLRLIVDSPNVVFYLTAYY